MSAASPASLPQFWFDTTPAATQSIIAFARNLGNYSRSQNGAKTENLRLRA
jgi:hypothetical protein